MAKTEITFEETTKMSRGELRDWLRENDINFSDYILGLGGWRIKNDPNYKGPFCSCCGAGKDVKDGHYTDCPRYEGDKSIGHNPH